MKRLCMGCMQEYDARYDVCPFCGYVHGTPPKEAYHMTPGTILNNKYIIGKVLGFGGFGITYIAYDKVLEQRVAIKEYMPGEFSTRMPEQKTVTIFSGEREEQFKEGLIKIEEEAKRLSKFSSVPNIVHIFDCFQANSTVYIVMEYLDGESLKDKLNREGKMSVQDAYGIVIKVIAAMKIVHREGIIHRDIAPDNIFILKNGDIKVIDFGAARYATTKHSKSLSVIIKPGYAPEEQYRSRGDQGTHTDVYALAATFYKMITGITPEDAMERSVKDMLKHPSQLLGVNISKSMDTAIMNALMVNIVDRTPTMDEFEEELNDADVKERKKTAAKDTSGSMPIPLKVSLWLGAGILSLALLAVLTINVAPRLGIDKILGATEVTVPNLVNQDYESIKDIDKLSIITDEVKYDDEYIEGRVISQDKSAGTTVAKDTEINVVVSAGSRPMLIPNLVGMRLDEAEKIAGKLYKNVVVEPYTGDTSTALPGAVLGQSHDPYSETIKSGYGDSITLYYNADGYDKSAYLADNTPTDIPESVSISLQELPDAQRYFYSNYSIYLSPIFVLKDVINNKYIRVDEYNDKEQDYQEVNIDVPENISRGQIIKENIDENANNKSKILHVYVYDGIKPFATDNYRGRELTEIQNLLISANVTVSTQYEFDPYVKANSIIRVVGADSSELSMGTILHSGDSVTLVVNNGIDPNASSGAQVETTIARPETTKAKVETTVAPPETTKAKGTEAAQKQPQTQPTTTAAPPPPESAPSQEMASQSSENTEMPTAVRPRRIERTQPEEEEETAEGEESTEGKKKKDTKKKKDKKKKSGEEVTEERATYFTEGFYVDENGDEQYTSYYYYIDD